MKVPLESVYFKYSVEGHEEAQQEIIDSMFNQASESHKAEVDDITTFKDGKKAEKTEDRISETDFFLEHNNIPEYFNVADRKTKMMEQMLEEFRGIGYDDITVENVWFQQYHTSDTHSWHTHGLSHWAVVYYVELPEGSPPTHLKSAVTGETLVPDVGEGDVLIIPAQTIHRSPPNKASGRKTIIDINIVCSGDCHSKNARYQEPQVSLP